MMDAMGLRDTQEKHNNASAATTTTMGTSISKTSKTNQAQDSLLPQHASDFTQVLGQPSCSAGGLPGNDDDDDAPRPKRLRSEQALTQDDYMVQSLMLKKLLVYILCSQSSPCQRRGLKEKLGRRGTR